MPSFARRVGRYLDLEVQGVSYEVYFESAGNPDGIPLVLQHTAGSDGRQWRHQLEDDRIGRDFHMLAYDLPYHAKSVPPTSIEWWKQEYKLTKSFLLDFVTAFVRELGLKDPVYMGSSIGGHLALDLALHRPGLFQAVIGLEAAIKSDPGNIDMLDHPEVSNSFKGDLMVGLTSPLAPEALRREVGWCYSQGAPPVFRGDLNYWGADHDLGERASEIDTSKTRVFLLTGRVRRRHAAYAVRGSSRPDRGRDVPDNEGPRPLPDVGGPGAVLWLHRARCWGRLLGIGRRPSRGGSASQPAVTPCLQPVSHHVSQLGVTARHSSGPGSCSVAVRGLHVYDVWHTYWRTGHHDHEEKADNHGGG